MNKDRFNLLVVEDNPAEVRLILEALKETKLDKNVHLDVRYDGAEAVDFIEKFGNSPTKPDLILLDLNLPKLNGKEVLKFIKGNADFEGLLVYIMTNSDNANDIKDCYDLKADGYFQKPTDFTKFIAFFESLGKAILQKTDLSVKEIMESHSALHAAI